MKHNFGFYLLFTIYFGAIGIAKAQLSGTYTVGANRDLPSLYAAFDSIYNAGTNGSVVFILEPKLHNDLPGISIPWAQQLNNDTITITSEPGQRNNTTIVLSWVTETKLLQFKRLRIEPLRSTDFVIPNKGAWISLCDHIVFDSCLIVGNTSVNGRTGLTISNGRSTTIVNCTFEQLENGVVFSNYGYFGSDMHRGVIEISDNTFSNQVQYPIKLYGRFIDTLYVRNNYCLNNTIGIGIATPGSSSKVAIPRQNSFSGNRILNATVHAVYARGTSNWPLRFVNNMLSGGQASGYSTGSATYLFDETVYADETHGLKLIHNSFRGGVRVDGTTDSIINNIFYSTKPNIIHSGGLLNRQHVHHNAFFVPSGNDSMFFHRHAFNTDVFGAKDNGLMANHNIFADPHYFSHTDLHACAPELASAGKVVQGIPIDIDNEVRLSPPDIGADEFKNSALPPCAAFSISCTDTSLVYSFEDISPRHDSTIWSFSDNTTLYGNKVSKRFSSSSFFSFTMTSKNSSGSDNAVGSLNLLNVSYQLIKKNGNTLSIDSGFNAYQWYRNNQPIDSATSFHYTATDTGTYSVQYLNEAGCFVWANGARFLSHEPPGMPISLAIHPNPFLDGPIRIESNRIIEELRVFSLTGEELFKQRCNVKHVVLDTRLYPKGFLLIGVLSEGQWTYRKLNKL